MKVVLAAAALLICAAPAHAEQNPANEQDIRRCVTQREPWTTPPLTRPEVERRWDVRGKGRLHRDEVTGRREWIYPLCDLPFPKDFAAAVFNRRGLLVAVATMEQPDAPQPAQPGPTGPPQILPASSP